MPRGEDVEIAETAAFLPLLVALFVVAPRALTFLLFFTELPSSFENLSAPSGRKIQVMHFLSLLGLLHDGRCLRSAADDELAFPERSPIFQSRASVHPTFHPPGRPDVELERLWRVLRERVPSFDRGN